MPSPSFSVSTEILAEPDAVFAYISDLSKHGEWAANELRIEPQDNAPLGVGKKYCSTAQVRGRVFHADLAVIEFSPPNVFAFSGADETGRFWHHFTSEKIGDRTRLTRQVNFELSLPQYVFYRIALNRVRLPAAHAALGRLKQTLETPG